MIRHIRAQFVMFASLTVITGVAYPLLVTGMSQAVFPHEANGSLIVLDGKTIGSRLIGQNFAGDRYFWPRPSATSPAPYLAAASTGSNLGPTNPALLDGVRERVAALRAAHADQTHRVPVDLVTASASGLDPHISPAAAEYQAARVARARNIPLAEVKRLIADHAEERCLGLLGERRVNVLTLNLALDALPAK